MVRRANNALGMYLGTYSLSLETYARGTKLPALHFRLLFHIPQEAIFGQKMDAEHCLILVTGLINLIFIFIIPSALWHFHRVTVKTRSTRLLQWKIVSSRCAFCETKMQTF